MEKSLIWNGICRNIPIIVFFVLCITVRGIESLYATAIAFAVVGYAYPYLLNKGMSASDKFEFSWGMVLQGVLVFCVWVALYTGTITV